MATTDRRPIIPNRDLHDTDWMAMESRGVPRRNCGIPPSAQLSNCDYLLSGLSNLQSWPRQVDGPLLYCKRYNSGCSQPLHQCRNQCGSGHARLLYIAECIQLTMMLEVLQYNYYTSRTIRHRVQWIASRYGITTTSSQIIYDIICISIYIYGTQLYIPGISIYLHSVQPKLVHFCVPFAHLRNGVPADQEKCPRRIHIPHKTATTICVFIFIYVRLSIYACSCRGA